MKELGRVTFSPDTTSGGGSPRASLERRVSREKQRETEKETERHRKRKRERKRERESASQNNGSRARPARTRHIQDHSSTLICHAGSGFL